MTSRIRRFATLGSLFLAQTIVVPLALAQDDPPKAEKAEDGKEVIKEHPAQDLADIQKRVVGSEIMMNPYGKFIALDRVFSPENGGTQPNWNEVYRAVVKDFNPEAITDLDIIAPLLLGSRIADGVLTVKMQDAGELGVCADDIERLAKMLGVSAGDIRWAKKAKGEASRGEWGKVYVSLGFLQMKVNQTLNKKASESQKTLLLVGGWMQATRLATTALEKGLKGNKPPDPSYHMREPKLAEALSDRVLKLPDDYKKNEAVKAMLEAFPKMHKIVDIDPNPMKGTISEADLKELKALATGILDKAMAGL